MPEAPSTEDQPIEAPAPPENPDQPSGDQEPASLADFDPSEIPENADREWFENRIKGFQADYTKKTQGIAEERREAEQAQQVISALRNPNPQIRAATLAHLGIDERTALELFGYQLEQEDDELADLDEIRDPRVDKLLQEWESEKANDELKDNFAAEVERLEGVEKRELSPKEQKALWRNVQGDLAAYGTANVEEIWSEMKELYSDREKALLDPKRTTARPPGNGGSGSRTVDLSKETPEERRERMASAADASVASQG
jgi:hypothetical protein